MKKNKLMPIIMVGVIVLLTAVVGCGGSEAKKALDAAIDEANTLLKEKPLDENVKNTLEEELSLSKAAKDDSEYKKATDSIVAAMKQYRDSVAQLKQVTTPSEAFLLERAKQVNTIIEVEAATEETDSNNLLNKPKGYTSYIALKSSLVTDEYYMKQSAMEAGNSGGGAIEAYRTVEDANTRNEYLTALDGGGAFAPGSHKVVGTLVIRTSNELKSSQQKQLEQDIINALTKLD